MVPAPRDRPDDTADPPADLVRLNELYQALPHPTVRWQTQPGRQFLDTLFVCTEHHSVKEVASALGISAPAIYYMMERPRPARPRTWPSPEDLRALNVTWRAVRAAIGAGRRVRRKSPEYAAVHRELTKLLERFPLRDLALAMGVPSRQLTRFTQPPLDSPEAVARAIGELLPNQGAERTANDNPAWRE